jgi:hypothetical protein
VQLAASEGLCSMELVIYVKFVLPFYSNEGLFKWSH